MIDYQKFTLSNGLRLLFHEDKNTPLAAINILYDVGARDEDPSKTGFAHLFEHLMFGGSKNIPSFDEPLQRVGGENNAYTNNDHTNYYLTLPVENLETGLWLESDRMNELAFTTKSLEVQRQVVMEEFKQRYLNQPYGDTWLQFRPLSYKVHPYRWATIGMELSHIANATMDDVKDFFYRYYRPSNAVICVAGNLEANKVVDLVNKWFGDIPGGTMIPKNIPVEPEQTERRFLEITRNVPDDMLYMGFHICGKNDDNIHAWDLMSDVLGRGRSSRLYHDLVKEKEIFSQVGCYITGDHHPGMLVFSGKIRPGISLEEAEKHVWNHVETIKAQVIDESELAKVKNKTESGMVFSWMNVLSKATGLCINELYHDAGEINRTLGKYRSVNGPQLQQLAQRFLNSHQACVLYYRAQQK